MIAGVFVFRVVAAGVGAKIVYLSWSHISLFTQSLQVRRAETLFILHFQWITALEERSWNLPGISPLKP